MLYIRVWFGDETDWITCTPNNPDESHSSGFDEGICTGFAIPKEHTDKFIE